MRVAHLTTVHDRRDPRIFLKECTSLAEGGHEVFLLVADGQGDERKNGVAIIDIGARSCMRLRRMTRDVLRMFVAAKKVRCDVYHFHDPELIPAGLLFRLSGKKVVYDVHEDYATSIAKVEHLPPFVRRFLALVIRIFEPCVARVFQTIIAEKYYEERLPNAEKILNYPLPEHKPAGRSHLPVREPLRVIYTGNITQERGAFTHVSLLDIHPSLHVYMIGRCTPSLAEQIRAHAGKDENRLHIVGAGEYMPFDTITGYYESGGWTAGLALFPPSEHYCRKELTKFFEYMQYGIPILASRFSVWASLIEANRCGVCVDPIFNREEMAAAVQTLLCGGAEMGLNGRRAVQEKYQWTSEEAKLLALYRRLETRD